MTFTADFHLQFLNSIFLLVCNFTWHDDSHEIVKIVIGWDSSLSFYFIFFANLLSTIQRQQQQAIDEYAIVEKVSFHIMSFDNTAAPLSLYRELNFQFSAFL